MPALQLPIGRAINNARLYVLDEHDAPVPWASAASCISAVSAWPVGIWGWEQMTAERFIDSPFVQGDRLYRTGDLVRYLPDGNLNSSGVTTSRSSCAASVWSWGKSRSCLLAHPALREVAVLIRVMSVCLPTSPCAARRRAWKLRTHVLAQLPEYMVPSAFRTA